MAANAVIGKVGEAKQILHIFHCQPKNFPDKGLNSGKVFLFREA